MLQHSEPSLKKWIEVTVKKKGICKCLYLYLWVSENFLVIFNLQVLEAFWVSVEVLFWVLSLFLSFKLYGAKQLIFTQGKKPHVTSDKLQDSAFKLPQVYCLVKWRAFFRALTESFNIVFSIDIALKILVLNANKSVKNNIVM